MKLLLIVLIVSFNIVNLNAQAAKQIDLNKDWIVTNTNFSVNARNVSIPNTIHTVLYEIDRIEDPLFQYNDLNLRYLTNDNNWVFKNEFRLNQDEVRNAKAISITFDSVDTISSIFLNGNPILQTNNQFLQYKVDDIKQYLKTDGNLNLLEVKFLSPVLQAKEAANAYPYRMPPECPPEVQKGECHVNMLRKKQCSFSWDWGPTYPNIGLNGPVYFTLINSFDFDFSVSVYPQNKGSLDKWFLDHLLTIRKADSSAQSGTVKATIQELGYEVSASIPLDKKEQEVVVKVPIDKNNIRLWWPNGYGEQKMYELKVEFQLNGEAIVRSKQIGFRSIQMVEELTPSKKQEHGLTFYFKLNNMDLFLKVFFDW